jgi:hypothetical protein
MTPAEREILAFIEKNQYIAKGTIRDCFPLWDIEDVLRRLESAGLVRCETRPTIQGECLFYTMKDVPSI